MNIQFLGLTPQKTLNINSNHKSKNRFMTSPIDKFENSKPELKEELKTLSQFKQGDKRRFSDSEIKTFSHMLPENLVNVKHFANTNLSSFNIKFIIEKNNVDFEKLGKIIENEENSNKNASVDFIKDSSADDNYILTTKTEKTKINKLLDENLNILSVEKVEDENDYKKISVVSKKDNTTINAKVDKNNVLISSTKTYKDNAGKTIKTEITELSDVEGVYNSKIKYANGKEEVISEGKFDKTTGISKIQKNMTSFDGTKTEYTCEFDKKGNKQLTYKIVDKNNKVLLDNKEKTTVLSDKQRISEFNNQKYEITNSNNNLVVKTDNKIEEIQLNGFARGDISPLNYISGKELLQLKNNVSKYNGSQGSYAAYDIYTKEVNTSDNKVSTLLHELGHAKDYRSEAMEISSDKDFEKIFNEEKELFIQNSSNFERELIEYFIRPKCHQEGSNGGKVEFVAEANAILNTPSDDNKTAMRKNIVQQYFPKSIAVLSNKLENFSDKTLLTNQNNFFGH